MTKTPAPTVKRLLITDANALFHRSRNALLRSSGGFSLPDGTPTTGTFGFTNNLLSVIDEVKPTHVLVVYDAGGNFRKEQSTEYKANREKSDDSFYREFDNVKQHVLPAFGIKTVGIKGVEADDVIFTVSHVTQGQFDEIVILTCDQDLLQCVTDKTKVLLFNSAKKKVMMGVDEVIAKLGVPPNLIPELKAIAGDGSDNIAGIKGIGPKTAVRIIEECERDWERVLEHKKVKPHAQQVIDNLDLTKSVFVSAVFTMVPDDMALGRGTYQQVDYVLERFHFKSLQKRRAKILKTLDINDGMKDALN